MTTIQLDELVEYDGRVWKITDVGDPSRPTSFVGLLHRKEERVLRRSTVEAILNGESVKKRKSAPRAAKKAAKQKPVKRPKVTVAPLEPPLAGSVRELLRLVRGQECKCEGENGAITGRCVHRALAKEEPFTALGGPNEGRTRGVGFQCLCVSYAARILEVDRTDLPARMLERMTTTELQPYLDLVPQKHRDQATNALWALEARGVPIVHGDMLTSYGAHTHGVRLADDAHTRSPGEPPDEPVRPAMRESTQQVRYEPDADPAEVALIERLRAKESKPGCTRCGRKLSKKELEVGRVCLDRAACTTRRAGTPTRTGIVPSSLVGKVEDVKGRCVRCGRKLTAKELEAGRECANRPGCTKRVTLSFKAPVGVTLK